MKQIFNIDISERKTFKMFGDLFILIARNIEHNTYLYKRIKLSKNGYGRTTGYEIVKPIKHKNPDGNTVYTYPSSDQFGYGRALYTPIFERALTYLDNGLQRITYEKQNGAAV